VRESKKSWVAPAFISKLPVFIVFSLIVIDLSVDALANICCLLKKLVFSSIVVMLFFFSKVLVLFMYLSKMIRKINNNRQMIVFDLKMLLSAGNSIVILTEILPKYPKVKKSNRKSAALVDAYKS
jgi:hypothetical protein